MSKLLFAISLMTLLACGSGEPDPGATGGAMDTPPVSAEAAAGDAADRAEIAEVEEAAALEGEQADLEAGAAVIQSCIDLVASGDYQGALPVCTEAAAIDADNADVQAALETAKAKAAKAATGAAADAAADALGGFGN